ncbi:MAG: DNA-binding LytR/AlgR family response regulator [Saprospiraceae bacterium]
MQINISDILYVEAAGNYTKIITTNDTITVREKISDLLLTLDQENLIQVHKSFAVTKKCIKSIEGNRIYIDGHIIPIGKMYKLNIIQLLG